MGDLRKVQLWYVVLSQVVPTNVHVCLTPKPSKRIPCMCRCWQFWKVRSPLLREGPAWMVALVQDWPLLGCQHEISRWLMLTTLVLAVKLHGVVGSTSSLVPGAEASIEASAASKASEEVLQFTV